MASTLMKDVVAYVEVRSSNDNRSAAVCRELQQLGARIESSFTDSVTHVVFKEGMRRTYNKAQKKGIPLVSVTWLESCKTNQKLMPEKNYAALIPEEPDSPLFHINPNRRWRKMKSMQPYEYEEEVARSAERSIKKRKRVEDSNRFKLLGDSTPTSTSSCRILVPETQGRSPFLPDSSSRPYSPSLATVADTPITPTMKDRIEQMRKEQNDGQSPKGTGWKKNILQKRLFEKLAKDIFSTDNSDDDEDDDTTARVVAKLINGLESQEEDKGSPSKRIRRMTSNENIQKQPGCRDSEINTASSSRKSPRRNSLSRPDNSHNHLNTSPKSPRHNSIITNHLSPSRKSPRHNSLNPSTKSPKQNSIKTETLSPSSKSSKQNSLKCNSSNLDETARSSPRWHSLNNYKDKHQIISEIKEGMKNTTKITNCKSPNLLNMLHEDNESHLYKNHRGPAGVLNIHPDIHTSSTVDATSKKKRMLLSEGSCSTLLDLQQSYSDVKKLTGKNRTSKKKEKNVLADEVSFLFGFSSSTKSNTATNRRRSVRLNGMNDVDSSSGNNAGEATKTHERIHLSTTSQIPTSSTNIFPTKSATSASDLSNADELVNHSMSVMYDPDSLMMDESLTKKVTRRSIDEFSLLPKGKKNKNSKRGCSLSDKCRTINKNKREKDSGAVKMISENENQIINSKEQSVSKGRRQSCPVSQKNQASSASEDEDMPHKLRHVSSLVMEISLNPLTKRSNLSLVMTSFHKHEQETALSVVKKLGVFKVTNNVDNNTTHVVCGEPRRTLNLLRAISRGCWVLSQEWVLASLEAGKWLLEEKFEMVDDFPVVKITRCNRMKNERSFQTDLFSKCGPILVAKTCTPPRKDLVDLITLCCGSVTNSQQRAAIYIDNEYTDTRMNIKPAWILDSIMKLELLNKEEYALQAPVIKTREGSPEY